MRNMSFGFLDDCWRFMPEKCEIIDDRIMLSNDRGYLRNNSEFRTFEFIDEMIEFAIEFLFLILFFMDAEL